MTMASYCDTDNVNSTESLRLPATVPWLTCPVSALLVTVVRSSRKYFLLHQEEEEEDEKTSSPDLSPEAMAMANALGPTASPRMTPRSPST
jgi:hypothetical protein